jgi:hypothetical protein
MGLEEARDLERALVLITHPHGERFHPAMEQEAGVRIEHATQVVEFVRNLFNQLRASDHCAGHDVGVAVQVLGATVQRQVEAGLRRAKIDRACEGVVDDRHEVVRSGELDHRAQVRHTHQRVGNRLDVDCARALGEPFSPRRRVAGVDEVDADLKRRQVGRQQVVSAAVQTILREQTLARAEQRQQRG